MRIYLASDHRGLRLKSKIVDFFSRQGITAIDLGTHTDARVDYVDYARLACDKVLLQPDNNRAILICGSGAGMDITANRHPGIRGTNAVSTNQVLSARHHDDINVLCLASDHLSTNRAKMMVTAFVAGRFYGGRYADRLSKLDN